MDYFLRELPFTAGHKNSGTGRSLVDDEEERLDMNVYRRIRHVFVSLFVVLSLGIAPTVLSATSASAWFTGNQGCTPGYWKNHTDAWSDTNYSPTNTVGSVFTLPASLSSFNSETLLDALNGGGGPGLDGATEILLRAAVSALLNASDPNVDYPGADKLIIKHVNAALATEDRDTILAWAKRYDDKNNGAGGCPLS